MTQDQINTINQMRRDGYGARKIAKSTGIPFETVKSHLRRHPDIPTDGDRCRYCGAQIQSTPKRRPRKYCSDKCRLAWWKEHSDELNRKAFYPRICPNCGQSYMAYGQIKSTAAGNVLQMQGEKSQWKKSRRQSIQHGKSFHMRRRIISYT